MGEVDYITSRNTPGLSVIEVHIRDTYQGADLPQVWDRLRARVADCAGKLRAGQLAVRRVRSSGIYGIYFAMPAGGFGSGGCTKGRHTCAARRAWKACGGNCSACRRSGISWSGLATGTHECSGRDLRGHDRLGAWAAERTCPQAGTSWHEAPEPSAAEFALPRTGLGAEGGLS